MTSLHRSSALGAAAVLGTLFAAASASGPAAAMPYDPARDCLAQKQLTSYLDRAFNEARVASGELENGHRIELFVSRRGSWTMVETLPNGLGCIHAWGNRMSMEHAVGGKLRPAS